MSEPAIRWTVKRNCSASPRPAAAVFASLVVLSLAIGVGFAMSGQWVVRRQKLAQELNCALRGVATA